MFLNLHCRMHTVLNSCKDACQWKYYDLLHKKVSFTVFAGSVPCGYNLAFYTSAIPSGAQYCDAQDGCTEIDFMECNAFSWHTTLHLSQNDKGGLPIGVSGTIDKFQQTGQRFIDLNGSSTEDVYGYGDAFLINTQHEFKATFLMEAPSGLITSVQVVLEQGSNRVGQTYTEPHVGYYKLLSDQLASKTNVLIASAWTGDMSWMDTPPIRATDRSRVHQRHRNQQPDHFVAPFSVSASHSETGMGVGFQR